MVEAKKYNSIFFNEMEVNSISAAKNILPIVNKLIQPSSVIDIGCGTGVWLKVWNEQFSIKNYLGIDGDYITKDLLKIPSTNFIAKDLKKTLEINQKFDLVMSLEVGEHLPNTCATEYVSTLTTLGNVVLFSAAIPGQTGTYHINEQYPEYWAEIFNKFDYVAIDYIRPIIWNNLNIEFYYKQNILFFVKRDALSKYPILLESAKNTNLNYLTRIHPFLLELKVNHINKTKTFFGYINWKWFMFKRKYIHKDPSL